jgi:hypothetical protein
MRPRQLIFIGALAAFCPQIAMAAERPVVVELFTSQGCSSCPPANAYLNELSKRPAEVLALAFHVTYWDYLGWKDPFSLKVATDRQARYGRRFGDGSYTPEIVVDGSAGLVGSDRDDVGQVIAKARAGNLTFADMRVVTKDGWASIDVGAGQGAARVVLVGFDREHVTSIGRGENRGITMAEANIVRSFRPVAEWSGAPIHLDAQLPEGEQVAVILEAPDGRIVGASRAIAAGSPRGVTTE